ncbi:FG-GAP repeat domain-containing protein [Nannocystis punicea]|uniref:VCBS repeat-containing protein n=1 Tax=Nannocystis punicea TaxID=2995304 RepID=A0ABY7GSV8_9BACT|nr:VCBS repeat-containing protein [Nannocystis poenicansa]WAS90044.1 VCBS repeat-containing protein [Nannocystis poenicansa]
MHRRAAGPVAWVGPSLTLAVLAHACAPGDACDSPAICLAGDQVRVWAGFVPDVLVVEDLDRDGARDFIGASTSGTLTVVWSGADGVATDYSTWSIGQEATGLAVADFDGDGHLDLAAAVPRADAVAVLRGRGARRFAAPEHAPVGVNPRALLAVDLDATAPPELVVANTGDGTVTVLRGLVAAPPVVVGPEPRALAAGDLDGDGDVDLAAALADADAVQVLLGDGDGGLRSGERHAVGLAPHALVGADFDADGRLDLATADALDDTVTVLWGDGRGGVRERSTWPTGPLPRVLALFVGPGGLHELAVLSESTSSVELLEPRKGLRASGAPTVSPLALAADGDGALYYAGSGAVGALLHDQALTLKRLDRTPELSRFWALDLEGDGLDEIVAMPTGDDYDRLELWRAKNPDDGWTGPIPTGLGWNLQHVVAGDLDGDGLGDLVAHENGELAVSIQQADETWPAAATHTELGLHDLALADLEGDGRDELLAVAGDRLLVLAGDSEGALELREEVPLDPPRWMIRAVDRGDEAAGLVLSGDSSLLVFERFDQPPREVEVGGSVRAVRVAELDADEGLDAIVCAADRLVLVPDVFASTPGAPQLLDKTDCWGVETLDIDGDDALDVLLVQFAGDGRRMVPWLREGTTWSPRGGQQRTVDEGEPTVLRRAEGNSLLALAQHNLLRYEVGLGEGLSDSPVVALDAEPALVFGDVDGDGATDLLAVGEQLAIAMADGRGGLGPFARRTFDFEDDPDVSEIPRRVWLADFDDDGVDEWIVVRRFDEHSELRLGRLRDDRVVSELLATLPQDRVGTYPADFDGDGALDLLALYSDEVVLFSGRGDGRFAAPRSSTVEDSASTSGVFDMDRDGALDLLSPTFDGVRVNPGRGDGSFDAARVWTAVVAIQHVAGDFDRDGHPDLVLLDLDNALLFVPGDGHGYGGAPRRLGESFTAIAAGDLDHDARPELLAAENRTGGASLHVGQSIGQDLRLVRHPLTAGATAIQAVDLGGDARGVAVIDTLGAAIVRLER